MNERASIRFEPAGRTVKVPVGSTLLEAARAAGLAIDAPCGGTGTCGSCRVSAAGALAPPTRNERELLGGAGLAAGKRLACRARVGGDATVTIEGPSREVRVVTSSEQETLQIEDPAERGIISVGTVVGAAVDIGTTTVAVQLLDLRTGEVLATVGDLNAQRVFGADVLSRVAFAAGDRGAELQRLIVSQLDELLGQALRVAGLSSDRLVEAAIVGNTAMTGLLLGADVSPLGEAPYAGAPTAEASLRGGELGIASAPALRVVVLPGASAFIGSDIIAGVLATRLAERVAPTLMIDLGTNGELVLAAGGQLLAASTAAGPALEGASVECGMRAEPGAIERVDLIGDRLALSVIGERAPSGICGSGLLDLVAALLDAGVIDNSGRFVDRVGSPFRDRFTSRDGVRTFVLDAPAGVVLTQKDVRQVQLAIGAVRTGIDLLLEGAGIGPSAIVNAVVAGGFGYHVRPESLVRLGLVPAVWHDRVTFGGNTALAGARAALVNSAVRAEARDIAGVVRTLDLAAHPEFQQRFLVALSFPG
ncbi:MAG: ASKHA domain-containing protein [Coriobacteriia bacterium]